MRGKRTALAAVAVVALSGCASILSGTSQTLTLRSANPQTTFYVDGVPVGTGVAMVRLPKKKLRKAAILARAPGCEDAMSSVATRFDAASLWGLLWDFGIVSILIIDMGVTGAAWEAEQTEFQLDPRCPVAPSQPPPSTPKAPTHVETAPAPHHSDVALDAPRGDTRGKRRPPPRRSGPRVKPKSPAENPTTPPRARKRPLF